MKGKAELKRLDKALNSLLDQIRILKIVGDEESAIELEMTVHKMTSEFFEKTKE